MPFFDQNMSTLLLFSSPAGGGGSLISRVVSRISGSRALETTLDEKLGGVTGSDDTQMVICHYYQCELV